MSFYPSQAIWTLRFGKQPRAALLLFLRRCLPGPASSSSSSRASARRRTGGDMSGSGGGSTAVAAQVAPARGGLQRTAVYEELLSSLPPEVAMQVEDIHNQQAPRPMPAARPTLQRAGTSLNVNEAAPTGAPSDITLQKRCAALEAQLDKWVSIAQCLASELAYRERRLWDWQMDNTNTKAILQKFKDRLKKAPKDGGGGGGSGWGRLGGAGASASSSSVPTGGAAGEAALVEAGTPRQIPTSASGISMLVVEPDESSSKALAATCAEIGYRVTTAASGEEALDLMYTAPKAMLPDGGQGVPFELVLCDVTLPGIPGVEVLNQMRVALKQDVSIIMLASDMDGKGAEMVERCIVEGADSYILKPAALKELTALWGFVARRRQHAMEASTQMGDLNHIIRSVEEELGVNQKGGSGQGGGGGGRRWRRRREQRSEAGRPAARRRACRPARGGRRRRRRQRGGAERCRRRRGRQAARALADA